MNTDAKCPACGASFDHSGYRWARAHFICGSYACDGEFRLTNQTDLCRAWETLRELSNLTTTDQETKAEFIARVRAVLGLPNEPIKPSQCDALRLCDCLHEINHALNHWYPTKTSADEDERNARHVRLFNFRDRLEHQLKGGKL